METKKDGLFAGGDKARNPFQDIKIPGKGEQQTTETNGKQKEQTKFWLNVGVRRGEKLVTLPMGIPLDNLKAKAIPGPATKNQDFRHLRMAESQLFDRIREMMAGLKPGETMELPLTVELRCVDEKTDEETPAQT